MNFRFILQILAVLMIQSCGDKPTKEAARELSVIILGIAQDAGYPQAGCNKDCCKLYYSGKHKSEKVISLGIVDQLNKKIWMVEATPDFKEQWKALRDYSMLAESKAPDGIFITHAHIGHYTGLTQLGHEVMGAKNVPLYVMPRMEQFIKQNGPWSQLINFENVQFKRLTADSTIVLSDQISITPFIVPHRDEYSETVGFKIFSKKTSILFIPDIDKWEKWNRSIVDEISKVDHALVDATFFKDGEIPGRNMNEILHPFIEETISLFSKVNERERKKIKFIHFNHTNPAIWNDGSRKEIIDAGFTIASEGEVISLY